MSMLVPITVRIVKHCALDTWITTTLYPYAKEMGHVDVLEYALEALDRGDGVVFLAYTVDHELIGAIAGVKDNDTLKKVFWYVINVYRGTDVAFTLDAALTEWGKEQGCTVMMAGMYMDNDPRFHKLMKRMGYITHSITYRKAL